MPGARCTESLLRLNLREDYLVGVVRLCVRLRWMNMYIHYIHPELRISNCRSRTGKGAGPLWREHRGSTEGARGEHGGVSSEHYGAVQGRSR